MNEKILNIALPILKSMRLYHRHEVRGMEKIPVNGRVLLVVSHSLATYDISLLFAAIYEELGRLPRPLADRLFFKFPYLGDLVEATGGREGSPENAKALLKGEELVAVAPGGMREALRPSSERYQILWEKRLGFARMAMETNTPVVLAMCPKADDLFDVYPNPLTPWLYRTFKIPLFLARGVGLSLFPKPIKLIHFVSEPIYPPPMKGNPKEDRKALEMFHRSLVKRARSLISEAIAYRPHLVPPSAPE